MVGLVGFGLQLGQMLQGQIVSTSKANEAAIEMNKSPDGIITVLLLVQDVPEKDAAASEDHKNMAFFSEYGLSAIQNTADEYQIILWKIEVVVGTVLEEKRGEREKKLDEMQTRYEREIPSGSKMYEVPPCSSSSDRMASSAMSASFTDWLNSLCEWPSGPLIK
jgi:hypothetical protein